MGFPRQEDWSGLSFPTPGDLLDLEIEPESRVSLALVGGFFITEPPEKLPIISPTQPSREEGERRGRTMQHQKPFHQGGAEEHASVFLSQALLPPATEQSQFLMEKL